MICPGVSGGSPDDFCQDNIDGSHGIRYVIIKSEMKKIEEIKNYSVSKVVMSFHCLNKLF